ncbi:coniferyl aldehyde dehydrogenase [mine drainage metagenome]|uniref:Coniferyl aldehyde dehydrogenase n=1 Tax=mine drainage metagenome TaxID=410659 RepID=T1CCT9_9ZZZZ
MDDLARLRVAFQARFARLAQAMSDDFGQRSRHESQLSDQMTVLHDIDHVRRHLKRWMRPRRRWADAAFFPARIEIRARPLGVVGVIAPWNYPVSLALMPLLEALAAGNHVMLKPSELTPRTSAALAELIAAVFPRERVTVVQGDAAVGAAFAALPFDHLVFTGSTAVGRKVALAAAANLTPVTLELGGKSPAIIAPGYALDTAAARIAQGKLLNAGQTCVAPDYVLLPRGTRAAFVQASRDYVRRHYPSLRSTPDFSSIVSDRHYARLHALVDDARAKGAEVITLPDANAHDAARRIFAPTLLLDAGTDMRVLQEEIFGPILPLLEYDTVEEAVAAVNRNRVRWRCMCSMTMRAAPRVCWKPCPPAASGSTIRWCSSRRRGCRSAALVPPAWVTSTATPDSSPSASSCRCSASRAGRASPCCARPMES